MVSVIAPNMNFPAHKIGIFLAGTITGAKKDWQKQITESLKDFDIVVFNPRRDKKPEDEEGIREQITWEYNMLRQADLVSFWFSSETVAPITLFELGVHTALNKPVVIGMDPKYPRRFDVEVQMGLDRPDIKIVYSLEDLSASISEAILAIIAR
jgi:nucleoside 2-deoxyribosyltransferase